MGPIWDRLMTWWFFGCHTRTSVSILRSVIFDPDIFGANRPGILGGYTHVVWLGMLSGSWEENSPNHFVANLRVTRLCTGSATEAQHAILASQCHDPQSWPSVWREDREQTQPPAFFSTLQPRQELSQLRETQPPLRRSHVLWTSFPGDRFFPGWLEREEFNKTRC